MLRRLATCLVLLATLIALPTLAAPKYPDHTSRVVDASGQIPAPARQRLIEKLADLETKTGHQLVIATVPSLDGMSVEDYANGLFRAWKIGRKDINDGVLLLVATTERKIRIEVGYGLEGTLTDAFTKGVISTDIAPRLKNGDIGGGLEAGVERLIAAMTGTPGAAAAPKQGFLSDVDIPGFVFFTVFGGVVITILVKIIRSIFRRRSGIVSVPQTGRRFRRAGRRDDYESSSSSNWGWSTGAASSSASSSSDSSSSSSDSSSGGGGDSGGGGSSGDY